MKSDARTTTSHKVAVMFKSELIKIKGRAWLSIKGLIYKEKFFLNTLV